MKKYKRGYTQGVYDMFHIGHLNILNRAKGCCDYLIVGVNADQLVMDYKHKKPVITQEDRKHIVENVKAVDEAFIVSTLDKVKLYEKIHFDAIFIGDDWKNNPRWVKTEQEMKKLGVDVVFLPHTPDVSSTILKNDIEDAIQE